MPLRPISPLRALALGTLTVGVLDLTDAFVFFGLRGIPPTRILKGIASGLLGRAAFAGGFGTALLGTALHFFIAGCIVAAYLGASRVLPGLVRRPLVWGPIYGIAVYGVMNFIVIPLSAIHRRGPPPSTVINGLLIHILGIGIPAALFARAAAAGSGATPAVKVTSDP